MADNPIVDAHIHQWDPLTTRRLVSGPAKILRWAPFALPLLTRMFPRPNRDFIGDPRYVLRPYLPGDYAGDSAAARVGTVVHIEAGWPVGSALDTGETGWVSSLAFGVSGAPALGAIIVHADPSKPQVAQVLDAHLAASPLIRGVRCVAAHSNDPGVMNWTKNPNLLADPAFLRGFAEVAERDLSFEIWVYAHQLPDALTLAGEYPEATFVLDHYATPIGALENAEVLDRWRDDVSALAALPNVVAKHSGLGMPVLGLGRLPRERFRDAVAPLVEHLDAAFGPQRAFWSSNFPIDKPNVELPETIWTLRQILGDRFDEDLMLRENARRVYRI